MFWALGPQAVGKATITGWRELVAPALADRARRYAIWPFDGGLGELLERSDAVIVEAYPADAYLQLGLRMGSRRTAKTRREDRRAEGPLLLERCRELGVRPERQLVAQIRDGFGSDRAGEDRFDATAGLLAMINALRLSAEPDLPDDPCVRRHEGWVFGRHARCPQADPRRPQLAETVTLDITTVGVGEPSCGGFVGSEPIFSTTLIPETTLPSSA